MLTGDGKALRRSVIGLTLALSVTLVLLVLQISNVASEWRADQPARSAARAAISPPRLPADAARLFGRDSYPASALRNRHEGRTVVELSVTRRGKVRKCRYLMRSGHRSLDRQTCRIAKRIRFEPARNADGDPVRSKFTLPVRWQLEK